MHRRALPLAVAAFAALLGWQLSAPQAAEPPPRPRVDASAYAIAWTRGGGCEDAVAPRADTGCGAVDADLTPR